MEYLIAHGADVNIANDAGMTPLMCASGKGSEDIVRWLLEAGASTHGRITSDGDNPITNWHTALSLAQYKNLPHIVELLEKFGATE